MTPVVAPGETVSILAERYGITASTIRWANGLDPAIEALLPGMRLAILPLSGVLHVVRPGETVEEIAARYQSVAEAIRSVNGVATGEQPAVGATLLVPGGRPAVAMADGARFRPSARSMVRPRADGEGFALMVPSATNVPSAAAQPAGVPTATPAPSPSPAPEPVVVARRYAVEAGDTILSIAERSGVSAEVIIASNNLAEADLLSIGQELVIPAQDGIVYVVREGDTLRDIAQRFGLSPLAIAQANGLEPPYLLRIDQQLTIPRAAAGAATERCRRLDRRLRAAVRRLSLRFRRCITAWLRLYRLRLVRVP